MDSLYDSENDILFPEEDYHVENNAKIHDASSIEPKNAETDISMDMDKNSSMEEDQQHLVCREYGNMFYHDRNINYNSTYPHGSHSNDIKETDNCFVMESKNNITSQQLNKNKKGSSRDIKIALIALAITWILLPPFLSIMSMPKSNTAGQTEITSDSKETFKMQESGNSTGLVYDTAGIAEKCSPSVVAITTLSKNEVMTLFGTYEQESEGAGSGVIIGETENELLIVTNYHVIQGVDTLTVCLNDDTAHPYSAAIKGSRKDYDIAVVSVKKDDIGHNIDITPAIIGNSDNIRIGEQVVAIGNALGLG